MSQNNLFLLKVQHYQMPFVEEILLFLLQFLSLLISGLQICCTLCRKLLMSHPSISRHLQLSHLLQLPFLSTHLSLSQAMLQLPHHTYLLLLHYTTLQFSLCSLDLLPLAFATWELTVLARAFNTLSRHSLLSFQLALLT